MIAGGLPRLRRGAGRALAACCLATAAIAAALIASPPPAGAAATGGAREYDLKATFLFHFTHFVEWPPEAFATPEAPFRLCVLAPDPFGEALRQVTAGELAAGRELQVRTVDSAAEAAGCQIVFVPAGRDSTLVRDLAGAREGLVLTVGERGDFLDHGGIVRFELRQGRLRLLVSRRALGGSQLRMSSKLLALARME